MKRVTVAGRCLACWSLTWATVEVNKHLPAAFRAPCAPCGTDELHALTGQLVAVLPKKSLRELRSAQLAKRAPRWEQLTLVESVEHDPDAAGRRETSEP